MEFVKAAESMGIPLYADPKGFISFFNSPYYAHRELRAIDIYSAERRYGEPGYSPVEGEVTYIRPFIPPEPKSFDGSKKDWIIVLKPRSNPRLRVRILHLKPIVEVGDKVEVGDEVGVYLRTGHFDFWTDPHIHVEVRDPDNLVRARGGYRLTPIGRLGDPYVAEDSRLEVSKVLENYVLVKPKHGLCKVGGFWGLGCRVGGTYGILDGGIPHYGFGGAYLIENEVGIGEPVWLGKVKIGIVEEVLDRAVRFKCIPIKVKMGEHHMRGLSLYLNLNKNGELKLVPYKPYANEDYCNAFISLSDS